MSDPNRTPPPQGHAGAADAGGEPITLRTLRRMARRGEPFACLTCYDASTARWLDRAGVHVLLVGDTAAEMILGHDRTINISMDFLVALTAGVRRGATHAMVMGDMPFLSYQADEAEAVRNAGRFLTEANADIVKIEADASFQSTVAKIVRAGIPVCGHVGSRPQRAALSGGYASAGRTADEAQQILDDARAMEDAGCALLLIEAVPEQVARTLCERASVPVIGIGAGPACHGQILVYQDLVGMSEHPPRFAQPVDQLGDRVQAAGAEWVRRVRERAIGGQPYTMKDSEAERFRIQAHTRAEKL